MIYRSDVKTWLYSLKTKLKSKKLQKYENTLTKYQFIKDGIVHNNSSIAFSYWILDLLTKCVKKRFNNLTAKY